MLNKKTVTHAGGFALILDTTDLSIAIASAHNDAKTLQERNHIILLSAVLHADTHKNNTPLLEFLSDIPKGINLSAMLQWLKEFTAYDFKPAKKATAQATGKDAKVLKSSRKASFTRKADRERAAATPYFELKEAGKDKKPFNIEAFVTRFITTLDSKKADTDKKARAEIAALLLKASQAFVDSFDAEETTAEKVAPKATTEKAPKVMAAAMKKALPQKTAAQAATH